KARSSILDPQSSNLRCSILARLLTVPVSWHLGIIGDRLKTRGLTVGGRCLRSYWGQGYPGLHAGLGRCGHVPEGEWTAASRRGQWVEGLEGKVRVPGCLGQRTTAPLAPGGDGKVKITAGVQVDRPEEIGGPGREGPSQQAQDRGQQ